MNLWTFLFLVCAFGIASDVWRRWLQHKERLLDSGGGVAEVEALRHRVEALETIVTDQGYDLKTRIDALDDPPRRRSAG